MLKGNFAADVVAMLAIITAVLMREYFAGVIIVIMQSGGEALENYSLRRASSTLEHLLARAPRIAHRKEDGQITEIEANQVRVGRYLDGAPRRFDPGGWGTALAPGGRRRIGPNRRAAHAQQTDGRWAAQRQRQRRQRVRDAGGEDRGGEQVCADRAARAGGPTREAAAAAFGRPLRGVVHTGDPDHVRRRLVDHRHPRHHPGRPGRGHALPLDPGRSGGSDRGHQPGRLGQYRGQKRHRHRANRPCDCHGIRQDRNAHLRYAHYRSGGRVGWCVRRRSTAHRRQCRAAFLTYAWTSADICRTAAAGTFAPNQLSGEFRFRGRR